MASWEFLFLQQRTAFNHHPSTNGNGTTSIISRHYGSKPLGTPSISISRGLPTVQAHRRRRILRTGNVRFDVSQSGWRFCEKKTTWKELGG
jgi:hypothetical protein